MPGERMLDHRVQIVVDKVVEKVEQIPVNVALPVMETV